MSGWAKATDLVIPGLTRDPFQIADAAETDGRRRDGVPDRRDFFDAEEWIPGQARDDEASA